MEKPATNVVSSASSMKTLNDIIKVWLMMYNCSWNGRFQNCFTAGMDSDFAKITLLGSSLPTASITEILSWDHVTWLISLRSLPCLGLIVVMRWMKYSRVLYFSHRRQWRNYSAVSLNDIKWTQIAVCNGIVSPNLILSKFSSPRWKISFQSRCNHYFSILLPLTVSVFTWEKVRWL